jgi:hypothetical protein
MTPIDSSDELATTGDRIEQTREHVGSTRLVAAVCVAHDAKTHGLVDRRPTQA